MGKITEERLNVERIDSKMFAHIVAHKCGVTEKLAQSILSMAVTTIIDLLANGCSVNVAGLGHFERVKTTSGNMVFSRNILMTSREFANKIVVEGNAMDKYIKKRVVDEKVAET